MAWGELQQGQAVRRLELDPIALIERQRQGTPAKDAESLRKSLGMQVPEFTKVLGIKVATYKKKAADKSTLTGSYGYAVTDVEAILAKARELLPKREKNFDVAKWFAEWIKLPQPSLGGLKPAELLDTPAGRALVLRVVGAMGSGVYL